MHPLHLQQLQLITDLYTSWRDTVEMMPLRFTYKDFKYIDLTNTPACPEKWINNYNANTGLTAVRFNTASEVVCYEGFKHTWSLIKSCKRGNDVYIRQVRKKFKPVIDASKNIDSFFSIKLNKNRKRVRKTKLLYITGTCDHIVTGDIGRSWLKFGEYWNNFITNIRQQFKGAEYIRAWQSQENGYPHFHALIYFPNFEFTAMYWDADKSWRVHNRQKLNGKYVRERLKDAWSWGHLDIKCCNNTRKALIDIVKYITRDLEGGESDLTNAMVWYFGKQSYSISGKFVKELVGDDIDLAPPSNDDLINAEGVIQRSNSNSELVCIEVFPLVKHDLLPKIVQKRVEVYEDPPDFPHETVAFLENLADSCKPVSFRVNENGVKIVVYDWKE